MSEFPPNGASELPKNRRWFVVLAIITLIGFAIFAGAILVLTMKIPELKKAQYGVLEVGTGARSA